MKKRASSGTPSVTSPALGAIRQIIRNVGFFIILAALTAYGRASSEITWGPATNIAGDSDISTAGTLDEAFNFARGDTSTGPYGPSTVNGVTFTSFPTSNNPASATMGNATVSAVGGSNGVESYNGYGSSTAPFANLSTSYQLLLSTGGYNDNGNLTLTLGGLTSGQAYQLEVFVDDSRGGTRTESISDTDGDSVSMIYNNSQNDGGVGQFVIGTFTADGTGSESVTFTPTSSGPSAQINAFQLRIVPEPSSAILAALGLVSFATFGRFPRRTK